MVMKIRMKYIAFVITFILSNFSFGNKYLYVEVELGGCNEPIPTSFYVDIPDNIDMGKIVNNDSLLVSLLNNSEIIYASDLMIFKVHHYGVNEQEQDDFITNYANYQKGYTFVREGKWDNFNVKLAIVEHPNIKYKNVIFGQEESVGSYEVDEDGIHIKVTEVKSYFVAYAFE
jgi:hypothetical protein